MLTRLATESVDGADLGLAVVLEHVYTGGRLNIAIESYAGGGTTGTSGSSIVFDGGVCCGELDGVFGES